MENTAIVLAGGLGKRLRPLTKTVPKPLLHIGKETILEIIISNLVKNGFKNIIIAVRYKSEKFNEILPHLKKVFPKIKINLSVEKKALGTCGPIKYIEDKLPNKFLLINGDILTNVNIKKHFLLFKKSKSKLLVLSKKIITPFSFGKILSKGNRIIKIVEKPKYENEILAGIYLIDKYVLNYVPKNKYFGIDQLLNKLIKQKVYISKKTIDGYWLDIGEMKEYERFAKK